MRRKDREVTDPTEIKDILNRCPVIRLALNTGEAPYVVPLSFGWEEREGRIVLYVHGAMAGRRHELMGADARVGVEADLFHRYVETEKGISCVYESLVGEGVAEVVTGAEAERGMACLMEHCGYAGHDYPPRVLAHTSLWRITLEALTGKRWTP